MMRKALKHELSNSWLEITIICVAFIVLSLFAAISIRISISDNNPNSTSLFLPLIITAMMILYLVAIVVLIINIIKSFNNKIFGNEGYLTLTLPLSIDKLLLSKLIVNFIWIIEVSITLMLGIGSIIMIVGNIAVDDILYVFQGLFENFWGVFLTIIGIIVQALFALVLLIFVLSILNIGKIKKFKFLIGLILYYLISTIFSWLSVLASIIPFQLAFDDGLIVIEKITRVYGPIFGSSGIGFLSLNMIFWYLLGTVGLYFLARHIIKNFVELE